MIDDGKTTKKIIKSGSGKCHPPCIYSCRCSRYAWIEYYNDVFPSQSRNLHQSISLQLADVRFQLNIIRILNWKVGWLKNDGFWTQKWMINEPNLHFWKTNYSVRFRIDSIWLIRKTQRRGTKKICNSDDATLTEEEAK